MKNLLKALLEFQRECPAVGKSASNPFFKSKYATLDAIQHHIQPYLQSNGLVVTQVNRMSDNDMPMVETNVWHVESGETISSIFPVVVTKATAQDYGSAVSYAKRYSLSGLLNLIIANDDDDGNKASGKVLEEPAIVRHPVTAQPTDKPTLTDKDINWNVIVDRVRGGLEIKTLEIHYKISQAVKSKLMEVANV